MKIILGLFFLIIFGIVIFNTKFIEYEPHRNLSSVLLIILPSTVLFFILILIPIIRMQIHSEIKQFKSIQQSITNARENKPHLSNFNMENAALYQEIIDTNMWLANLKYWKATTFSLWIPDEVDNLSEIK